MPVGFSFRLDTDNPRHRTILAVLMVFFAIAWLVVMKDAEPPFPSIPQPLFWLAPVAFFVAAAARHMAVRRRILEEPESDDLEEDETDEGEEES